MSIIPCANDCKHQTEGYCTLEKAAAVTNTSGGCPHYEKNKKTHPSALSESIPFYDNRVK